MPFTCRCSSTSILPFFDFGSVGIDWMSGCGELGTVGDERLRLDALAAVQDRRLAGRRHQARAEADLHAALRELALREDGELLVHLREDAIHVVEQDDADLLVVDATAIVRRRSRARSR